jgi:hypothetical protein
MSNLNFYFTGKLVGGHYRYWDTSKMNQDFLKNNLIERLKNPNLIDSHFEDIAKHLEPFYQKGKEGIKTDISGIIVPICHGDISDYFHIAVSIKGDFERNLRNLWKSNGIYEEHPENPAVLKIRANLTEQFINKVFNIPLFEAYKFLLGYRIPFPRGKEEMSIKERIACVENAFNSWIKENFEK